MMGTMRHVVIMGLGLLVPCALTGCVNLGPGTLEAPRFYVLSSLADGQDPAARQQPQLDSFIGVGPVTMPAHLNRPQVVSRTDPNQIQVLEMVQWAEPLDANVRRVVAENLSVLLGTERVYEFPWDPSIPIEVQVAVNVVRFDASPGDQARFEARWTILRGHSREAVVRDATRVATPVEGPEAGAVAIVVAQSRALEQLSREIAAAIRRVAR